LIDSINVDIYDYYLGLKWSGNKFT